jgi:mono/diheme cytochrome c family protein
MRRLAVLLSIICAGGVSCGRPAPGREQRDFERMRQQQRYDSYSQSGFFHNGAVMQAPPAHTIARVAGDPWSGRVQPVAFLTGASGASDVTAPPMTIDATVLSAGREQYGISCAPCHGSDGWGGGVMAANLASKRPPSLRTPPVSTLPAGTIFKVITDGFGRMPPYGWQLPIDGRWAVVAYIRSLSTMPATAASRADSLTALFLRQIDSTHAFEARLQMRPPNPDSIVP